MRNVLLALLLVAGCVLMPLRCANAGIIRNTDKKEYKYTIHWEDLSKPETFSLGPGETQGFDERKATIVLQGHKDNIYVRPGETILIINGVMRIEGDPAANH